MSPPTPSELAVFDQSWAKIRDDLNQMVAAYRKGLAAAKSCDTARLQACHYLITQINHKRCALLLARAVDALCDPDREQPWSTT